MGDERDISDEAVRDATGRSWDEWFETLDDLGAREMEHGEVASTLQERGLVDSGWWAQSVTVAYEKETGQRLRAPVRGPASRQSGPASGSSPRRTRRSSR